MPEAPTLAVIVPVLNEAAFVREALDSLLEQAYPQVQVLAFDAGSTDGTLDILRSYPIQLVVEPDLGQMAAINRGWQQTTAEFVTWMAGDDRLRPGALGRLAQALRENPRAAVAHANASVIDEHGAPITTLAPGNIQLRELVFEFTLVPQTALIRRAALSQAGLFDESLRLAADYDLFLRLAQYSELHYVPFTAADYRVHAGSQDSENRGKVGAAVIEVVSRFFERGDLTAEQRGWRRRGMAGAYLFAGAASALDGDRRAAWGLWRKAVGLHPRAAWSTRRGLGLLARLLSPIAIAPYGLRNLPRKLGAGLPRNTSRP